MPLIVVANDRCATAQHGRPGGPSVCSGGGAGPPIAGDANRTIKGTFDLDVTLTVAVLSNGIGTSTIRPKSNPLANGQTTARPSWSRVWL